MSCLQIAWEYSFLFILFFTSMCVCIYVCVFICFFVNLYVQVQEAIRRSLIESKNNELDVRSGGDGGRNVVAYSREVDSMIRFCSIIIA